MAQTADQRVYYLTHKPINLPLMTTRVVADTELVARIRLARTFPSTYVQHVQTALVPTSESAA